MKHFFCFFTIYCLCAHHLCASLDDEIASEAQVSEVAARLDIMDVIVPGFLDFHAWFDAQETVYVDVLNALIHGPQGDAIDKGDLLLAAYEGNFTLDELRRVAPYTTMHPFVCLLLPCVREGNDDYVGACAQLFGRYLEDRRQPGTVIEETSVLCERDLATNFLNTVRAQLGERLGAFAACPFRTFELQRILPYAAQVTDEDLPHLHTFLRHTCPDPLADVSWSNDTTTSQMIEIFIQRPKESLQHIFKYDLSENEIKDLLLRGGAMSNERAHLSKYLREEEPGHPIGFDLACLYGSGDVKRLLCLSPSSRHSVLMTMQLEGAESFERRGFFSTLKGLCRMVCLYEGCDKERALSMRCRMYENKTSGAVPSFS